jgi:hypothetical protein
MVMMSSSIGQNFRELLLAHVVDDADDGCQHGEAV